MSGLHNVLEAAAKVIDVDPARFDDGSKPMLSNRAYVELGVWMATRAIPKMSASEKTRLEEIFVLARLVIEGKKLSTAQRRVVFEEEDATMTDGLRISRGLRLDTAEASINNVCGKGLRYEACAAARLLGERPFLDELAQEILRLDAVTTAEKQRLPVSARITKCLWRGKTGAKLTHLIVEIEAADGTKEKAHGLIAKTKGRWTWMQGDRDDILATIPDALMESAVASVIGGARKSESKSGESQSKKSKSYDAEIQEDFYGVLAGVAIGSTGRMWAVTNDGRLSEWDAKVAKNGNGTLRHSGSFGGKTKGIHAGKSDVVVTFADGAVVVWRALGQHKVFEPSEAGAKVLGAFVLEDDKTIVSWHGSTLDFTATTPSAKTVSMTVFDAKAMQVSLATNAKDEQILVASSSEGIRIIDPKTRKIVFESNTPAERHAVEPGGRRIAVWSHSGTSKKVDLISIAANAAPPKSLALDAAQIDRVVFVANAAAAGSGSVIIMVRYHDGKRIALFDGVTSKKLGRVAARDLNEPGSSVDEIAPLKSGAILAFAPYPHGDAMLVDAKTVQLIARWRLKRFYTGGKSSLADDGKNVLFGHAVTSTRLLRFRNG